MKRQLKTTSQLTLSPPLPITAETFTLVTEFCYGSQILITPFNVAPLRIAAELLEMTEATDGSGDDSLRQKTEAYFQRAVPVNQEFAKIVLRSGVSLLPEAETKAGIVSRCIEALVLMHDDEDGGGWGKMSCLNDVLKLQPHEFQVLVEAMNQRLTSHDILYRVVDLYLKGYAGKITEEQKIRMCNYIDCTILSSQGLMHAVQNPAMPLRFIVQAMFVEQLNTRRSIFSAADNHNYNRNNNNNKPQHQKIQDSTSTLGAILQRDAALRQVAQLKAAMDTTNSRIQSLEKELIGMRKRLQDAESHNHEQSTLDSGRSQSFRFSSENRIERGQIGSVSSASFLSMRNNKKDGIKAAAWSISSDDQESCDGFGSSPVQANTNKKLGRRFMDGLKSAFRVTNLVPKKLERNTITAGKVNGEKKNTPEKYEIGGRNIVIVRKDPPYQR
ncbi:OLC1v1011461C2 [Oldenlandia corymbosa var. corymbosa]|nr:OLC1v1011461C2 [Oldenlandia corymbosa var. corymbosa]